MTRPILAMIGGFMLAFSLFAGGLLVAVFFMVPGEPWHSPARVADDTDLWAEFPRRVVTNQNVARVSAPADRTSSAQTAWAKAIVVPPATTSGAGTVDGTNTATVSPEAEKPAPKRVPLPAEAVNDPVAAKLYTAHAEWCAGRYRSYNLSDNTYKPYSGGRRACVSPGFAQYAALTGTPMPEPARVKFDTTVERPSPAAIETAVYQGEALVARKAVEPVAQVRVTSAPVVVADNSVAPKRAKDCSHYKTYDAADNTYQPYGGGPRKVCQ